MSTATAVKPKKSKTAAPAVKLEVRTVAIDKIRLDGGTQARTKISDETINEYRLRYNEGVAMPPIRVCFDGVDYWPWDGFHRYHAQRKNEATTIEVEVRPGTQRDAIFLATSANRDNGLQRAPGDTRRAVEMLLNDPEWSKMSDREIARHVLCSHTYVGGIREKLAKASLDTVTSSEPATERTYTRAGKTVTMNTSGIAAANAARVTKPEATPQPPATDPAPQVERFDTRRVGIENGDPAIAAAIAIATDSAASSAEKQSRRHAPSTDAISLLRSMIAEDDRLEKEGDVVTSMGELIDKAREIVAVVDSQKQPGDDGTPDNPADDFSALPVLMTFTLPSVDFHRAAGLIAAKTGERWPLYLATAIFEREERVKSATHRWSQGNWIERMAACKTADDARDLFREHEGMVNAFMVSLGIKPLCGKIEPSYSRGFSTVKPKEWAVAIAEATAKSAEDGRLLAEIVEQGQQIHGDAWKKLLDTEQEEFVGDFSKPDARPAPTDFQKRVLATVEELIEGESVPDDAAVVAVLRKSTTTLQPAVIRKALSALVEKGHLRRSMAGFYNLPQTQAPASKSDLPETDFTDDADQLPMFAGDKEGK